MPHHKAPSCWHCIIISTSLPLSYHPSLNSQLLICSPFRKKFVICRILYKWNFMVYNFGNWLFSLSTVLWRFIWVVLCINSFLLLLSSSPWYACTRLFNHAPGKRHLGSFLTLQIKLLCTFIYKCLCEHKLLLLWDKYLRVKLLGYMVCELTSGFSMLFHWSMCLSLC